MSYTVSDPHACDCARRGMLTGQLALPVLPGPGSVYPLSSSDALALESSGEETILLRHSDIICPGEAKCVCIFEYLTASQAL